MTPRSNPQNRQARRHTEQPARGLYPIADAAHYLGISESRIWQLMNAGDLRAVKLGRRRLIPADALDAFIAQLPAA